MATPLPLVLVDGDPLVYSCGFGAQRAVIYDLIEPAEGDPFEIAFDGKAERNKYLKENPEVCSLGEPLEQLLVEPVEFCLHSIKNQLKILAQMGPLAIYLTGTGNYRDKIKRFIDYKGNRDRTKRPVHYEAIRQYLIDYHGAIVVNGREADDELSIVANRKKNVIIASCDKDLDQIPGRHYDYWKQVEYVVSEQEAERMFWIQALAGDHTDNVPGCWKIGPGRAAKIIDYAIGQGSTLGKIWASIVDMYKFSRAAAGCPYADEDHKAIALENAQMVYIQKRPGELWMPPGTPFGKVELDAED